MSSGETGPPGPDPQATVCFCFGYSVADVRAARREGEPNAVVVDITDRCRRGLGRCAQTNPSGRCCLATVRALARGRRDPKPTGCCDAGPGEV